MNKKITKYVTKLLKHLQFYNSMAPFPIYDTEYVQEVKKFKDMLKETKVDYDEEPVVCCSHCKSLHITYDDDMNEICNRCGSINELEVLDDIHKYEKKYGHIWK